MNNGIQVVDYSGRLPLLLRRSTGRGCSLGSVQERDGGGVSNGLTGDFDLVLQVSDGTVDRLAASMHQNGFMNPNKPSLPHIVYFRLDGSDAGAGERGSVAAQVGVPHIALIDRATDRFWVEIGFRARFRADPGSPRLADVINGTIRALYRIQDIDPDCLGWEAIAGDYLWLHAVKTSVAFDGTAYVDTNEFALAIADDEQTIKQRISKHLAELLAERFQPKPHYVGKQFRRFRTLSSGRAVGLSGVTIPVQTRSGTPAGELASVSSLFLNGHDFALAVSREYMIAAVEPHLAQLNELQRDFHVHADADVGGGLEIDYHVRIDTVTAEWLGPLTLSSPQTGFVRIRATGVGWASHLYRSGVFNVGSVGINALQMGFSVDQLLALGYDPSDERLTVTAFGAPAVTVGYGGPFAAYIVTLAKAAVAKQVQSTLSSMVGQAQNDLDKFDLSAMKRALIDQLRSIDDAVEASFTDAAFRSNGLVLHGSVRLTSRHAPKVSFVKTAAGDGFDAIESWIPGGRVDTFAWSWRWFTNPAQAPPGPPGAATETDSFLLRRPHGPRSRFGLMQSVEKPLPGLDGSGQVCLTIKGVRVDEFTGRFVPVESNVECAQFGFQFTLPAEIGAYLKVCDPLQAVAGQPVPEVGILRTSAGVGTERTCNVLVLSLGEKWNDEAAAALVGGVDHCERQGAGLLVLVLFRDGALETQSRQLRSKIKKLAADLPAPLLVTEDVRESFSQWLALPTSTDQPEWRLMTPTGAVNWAHQGHIEPSELASTLDDLLVTSRPAELAHLQTGSTVGGLLAVRLARIGCPPIPFRRPGTTGSKVLFIDKRQSSINAVTLLKHDRADSDNAPYVAVVVDGAAPEDIQALASALDTPIFPDPTGTLTRDAGVRFTPSVFTFDQLGRLVDINTEAKFSGDHANASERTEQL